jgi:hypothetical protein
MMYAWVARPAPWCERADYLDAILARDTQNVGDIVRLTAPTRNRTCIEPDHM